MTAKTGKTGKDEVDEVEAVPAEEQAETEEAASGEAAEAAAAPARPAAKRKRRVRVIEVIDDEDLDEVLEALDAEDAAEAEAEAPAEPAAKAAPKPAPEPVAKPAVQTVKPRPAALEPPEKAEEKEPARTDAFSLPLVPTVVLAVLIVVLGGLAIWQGTSAHSLSSKQDEREAIGKVASAYGDVAYNYNAANYQTQTDKAMKLLAGDMLDDYKKNTVPTVASAFQADAQVVLSSKSNQVFVGSVNGKFATAVLMMDMSLKTKSGAINQPATLLRLSLSKIDGDWKITQQYPSGINDQNRNQQQGQIPGVPSGGGSTSPSPKAENSEKPKN
ncbi:hypothetical protein [Actinomadura bangladeshensis]|uniref:Mce-associated membrane protein n=1 Tax=Actinomadura bangladeshensis TaxID=453573 RepID=A0A4R4P4R3_9ACTN|nr:hypothetical protein [Actinomadura bangladeshensis]TDC15720.1 hypothetical protein E1284_14660 [Actinomadura bangladeshensis]